MNKGVSFAAVALAATIAPLAACANQQGGQSATSTSSSAPPGTERMTTQLKSADGNQVGTATIDFANGYATVTVEAGPNQVLSPGFHALMIHAVGKCEGDFDSAGSVYQAPNHTGFPASGDLTALQVRNDGSAKLVTTTSLLTASDLRSSSGTALIVHQNADNLSGGSTGESGKRVACGVLAAASATTTSSTSTTTSVTTITTTTEVPPPSTSTSTVTVTSSPTYTSTPITTVTTTPPSLPPGTR
ncbi:superoxide dismutase [Mycobacterium sp. 852002-53434_SCH5985345]|uniref:superoxide dismutase family protein n=1 Tax=unclassified Mycobacterium TaxID=2642494 RepID=UPI0007FD6680|nr:MULTISPECIES: superoxide dismutase family protein [unclassified Mycobacterium]OBF61586.1 superoxide dismutase [Mycobacterium sp. 852002-53434_SCH5985345]OBF73588.1 superoxide dismutase [Mycobacterium sp. 852002-51613_SCH5001154]OBG00510.1 superoxide dismutase [Mycobacterium sp. 852014-52450_SCH5900713]